MSKGYGNLLCGLHLDDHLDLDWNVHRKFICTGRGARAYPADVKERDAVVETCDDQCAEDWSASDDQTMSDNSRESPCRSSLLPTRHIQTDRRDEDGAFDDVLHEVAHV